MSENTDYDYKVIAETAYQNIKLRFDPAIRTDSYWDLGNALDTATDYLLYARGQVDPAFIETAYKKYLALVGGSGVPGQDAGCWYDDFAWWGNASAKAFDKNFDAVFGNGKKVFQNIARECWRQMTVGMTKGQWVYRGASNVWDNRDNGTPDNDYWNKKENWATPRFDNGVGSGCHGVWQYDIFHEKREQGECSSSNPSDPNFFNLGPWQDTVVNALFFLLALKLNAARATNPQPPIDPSPYQPVRDEYGFLNAWFDAALEEQSLLLRFPGGELLVKERVTSYAEIDGAFPPVKLWNDEADSCWAGDQGLVISGLLRYYSTFNQSNEIASQVRQILYGVARYMTEDNVIQYHHGAMGDPGDYECGVGVFMRNFLDAYVLQPNIVKPVINDLRDVILATTNSLCGTAPSSLFDNLNLLSTLTTARYFGVIQF